MKSKGLLIGSIIASLLLVGCNSNNKKSSGNIDDKSSLNSDASSSFLDTSSFVDSSISNSNSSRDNSSNVSTSSTPEIKRTVSESEWKNIFSKNYFSNFKGYYAAEASGKVAYDSVSFSVDTVKNEYKPIEFNGKTFKSQVTEEVIHVDISKEEFHEYYASMGGSYLSEEALVKMALSVFQAGYNCEFDFTGDTYSLTGRTNEAYPSYIERDANKPILNTVYSYSDDFNKYIKINQFADENELNPLFDLFTNISDMSNSYSKFKFDSTSKSYVIPKEEIQKAFKIEDEDIEIKCANLYFANGEFDKIVISIDQQLLGNTMNGSMTFGLLSRGDAKISVPTDLYECEHSLIAYCSTEDYHYQECDDCRSILEIDTHKFTDGVCSCGFELLETEEITFDCCEEASVYVSRNAVTNEIRSVDVYGLESEYHDDSNVTYTCEDVGCNFRIEESVKYDLLGSHRCETITESNYEFYNGTEQVHDPISFKTYDYNHVFVLVSMGDKVDGPNYFESDYTFYEAEVKCAHCGYEVPNAVIYFDGISSNEQWDDFSIQSTTEPTYFGEIKVPHNVKNGKCEYCGMSESNIEKVDKAMDFSFEFDDKYTEFSVDDFLSKYTQDNQVFLRDKYNKITINEYDGGYDIGVVNRYTYTRDGSEFIPDDDAGFDSYGFMELSTTAYFKAKTLKSLSESFEENEKAKYYIGEKYLKIAHIYNEGTSDECSDIVYFTLDGCFAGYCSEYYGYNLRMSYIEPALVG